jgi:hypothetical protein
MELIGGKAEKISPGLREITTEEFGSILQIFQEKYKKISWIRARLACKFLYAFCSSHIINFILYNSCN